MSDRPIDPTVWLESTMSDDKTEFDLSPSGLCAAFKYFFGRDTEDIAEPFFAAWQADRAQLAVLEAERDHWIANHNNMVALNALLRDRPDLGERANLVQRLVDKLAALEEANRWRSVKDELPIPGYPPLLTYNSVTESCQVLNFIRYCTDGEMYALWQDDDGWDGDVTHWKPLPAPPEKAP